LKGIIVQKYGGTSVANPERIKEVAKMVVNTYRSGKNVVVVVSAPGDTTDDLIELSKNITENPSERELDMLLSTGEQVSSALLAMAIQEVGENAISFTGAQVGIITDNIHTKAKIICIKPKRILEEFKKGKVVVVAGFQGSTEEDDITTLGRGGSNLTAVALAKALKAECCQMYTDVDGVYTADPRIVPNARKIDRISYDEMLEMASLGSQILQARSVEFAKKYNVTIDVRSSFTDKAGTLVVKEVDMEGSNVSGVAVQKDEAKITLCDVPDRKGIAAKIFRNISDANINVDMIVQNVSRSGITDISFTVHKNDVKKATQVSAEIAKEIGAGDVHQDLDIAKVSIVGAGMRAHSGVAAKMFEALAKHNINIEMISTSEIKISCVIEKKYAEIAARAIHDAFELGKK
jgi:aspartate kinase